ncbi:MAG: penicillin-binding protein, partial [Pseudomonadota bacterium]
PLHRAPAAIRAGLQGGRAPARAFAAYMRYAVKDRAVEEFDIELNLPEWQLEPDEEALFGDPDDYYFIDEQGNLIEPGRRDPESPAFDIEGERALDPVEEPPAAVSDDFLDEAIGGAPSSPPPRPDPPDSVNDPNFLRDDEPPQEFEQN